MTISSRPGVRRGFAGNAGVIWERSLLVQRHTRLAVAAGFFEPVFYLAALGVGFGAMVGTVTNTGEAPLSYPAFVAPALLACSAMNGALYDAVYNVYYKLSYTRLYETMVATSLGPVDVAVGEIAWATARGGGYAAMFLAVMVATGTVTSWWALLALPAALLIALAFAAAGMAATTYLRNYRDFELVNLVVLPMFLFSTTFSPLSVYPRPVQPLIEVLPLYQGVALVRSLTSGSVGLDDLGHVGYLIALAALGALVATSRLSSRLHR
jgi:lipooligosaccharide transport system permease protein